MDATRFDSLTRLFSNRRISRRKAVAGAGTGIAASALAAAGISGAAAQDSATPVASDGTRAEAPAMLFVQSFQAGSIEPKAGEEGRYTVTLDHGLGETIYFSDRPERIVGSFPTDKFLDWLGFTPDNPPNAAILTDNGDGETTLAVVELFDPVYDADTATASYDLAILDHWQDGTSLNFTETPVDLGTIGATFGTTHLFIDGADDCPDATMSCMNASTGEVAGTIANEEHDGYCYFAGNFACFPCEPWVNGEENHAYWLNQCEERFEECAEDGCYLWNYCTRDAPLGHTWCKDSDFAINI